MLRWRGWGVEVDAAHCGCYPLAPGFRPGGGRSRRAERNGEVAEAFVCVGARAGLRVTGWLRGVLLARLAGAVHCAGTLCAKMGVAAWTGPPGLGKKKWGRS